MAGTLTPRRIHLKEYGAVAVVPPGVIDVGALAESNKRWKRLLKLSRDPLKWALLADGHVELRAQDVTGVVRIGDTDIEIAPKFLNDINQNWQSVLWRILTVVEGGYVDENRTAAHEIDSSTLPDLLAEMFLASYAKGAARGLPRGYQPISSSGPVLRGNLDQSRIGNWVARPWEVPFVTDLFTDDTTLARLLRWTAEHLASTVTAPGRAREVREIAGSLSHVGRRPPHLIEAQRIHLGIQHRALEPALAVGIMLLEGAGVHHAQGEHALSGFLWNSDVIYENFVYWLCSRAAAGVGGKVNKKRLNFGELLTPHGTNLETTPDVVFHSNDGTVLAVTDSKYKNFGTRPKAADTYQVLTAGQVLGCQRVSLTYPVGEDKKPTMWRVPSALGGKDIELSALPLNLMSLAEPGGQTNLVATFTRWLEATIFEISDEEGT